MYLFLINSDNMIIEVLLLALLIRELLSIYYLFELQNEATRAGFGERIRVAAAPFFLSLWLWLRRTVFVLLLVP
jgi:hypothetical protein